MYSMHGLNTTSCGNAGKSKHNMISYDIDFGSISRHGVLKKVDSKPAP